MSTAPAPSGRRPRRAAAAALAVAAIALLGACTHQRQIPDKYGETTLENFTDGCVGTLTQNGEDADGVAVSELGDSEAFTSKRARDVCGCAYEGISGEGGIPFERFKEITEAQEDEPGPLPAEITEIMDRCVEEFPA